MGLLVSLLASTLRVSTPLVFASLGGFVSERSGVINIALEGMMLIGAFTAAVIAHFTHSAWGGALAGGLAGSALAAIYGLSVIRFRANQIVAGTAINFLAAGFVPSAAKVLFNVTGSTPALEAAERFDIAPIFIAGVVVFLAQFFLKKTPGGLWLSFAGEHPQALDASGVRVNRVRWIAVLVSGFLAGLGGSCLSIFLSSAYSRNMTAGRGFMALAALILGKWRPLPAALACVLFGLTEAAQTRLQGMVLWGTEPVPVQFIQILPYIVTVIVLAGWIGESRPPKQLGVAYRSN
jgi:simple sugar transport system permease protein